MLEAMPILAEILARRRRSLKRRRRRTEVRGGGVAGHGAADRADHGGSAHACDPDGRVRKAAGGECAPRVVSDVAYVKPPRRAIRRNRGDSVKKAWCCCASSSTNPVARIASRSSARADIRASKRGTEAVRSALFRPYVENGIARAVLATIPIEFTGSPGAPRAAELTLYAVHRARQRTQPMAARKSATKKKTRRGKLAPGRNARGLSAAEMPIGADSPESPSSPIWSSEAGGAPIGAYREPLGGRPLLLASLPLERRAADAVPARSVADAREAARREDRGDRRVPRSADRRARRRRAALDAERPASAGRGESARAAADHGARLAGRGARLPHPRAQHREGAQPQGPQPRGDPHGAQPREARARTKRESAVSRGVRGAGAAHARHRLRAERRASPAAPTARS